MFLQFGLLIVFVRMCKTKVSPKDLFDGHVKKLELFVNFVFSLKTQSAKMNRRHKSRRNTS